MELSSHFTGILFMFGNSIHLMYYFVLSFLFTTNTDLGLGRKTALLEFGLKYYSSSFFFFLQCFVVSLAWVP